MTEIDEYKTVAEDEREAIAKDEHETVVEVAKTDFSKIYKREKGSATASSGGSSSVFISLGSTTLMFHSNYRSKKSTSVPSTMKPVQSVTKLLQTAVEVRPLYKGNSHKLNRVDGSLESPQMLENCKANS
ncbi:hypothetical protein H6P81_016933 [Aristolochia fimbriata]|uniref:Uncharacterized protein n=1 Tax=Aristolochia fimbriata TaxID=158543 RepID=A0AAV7DX48_ARIFI|nr:hypothetical protein H6P81_016933 [Aristolochia fimbriata]